MDLQVKLVDDGRRDDVQVARGRRTLPTWAVWKNEAYGTTYEPVAYRLQQAAA